MNASKLLSLYLRNLYLLRNIDHVWDLPIDSILVSNRFPGVSQIYLYGNYLYIKYTHGSSISVVVFR